MGGAPRALVLVTLGLVVLAGITWRGVDILAQWFLDERSLLSRIDAWKDAWDVVRNFPVFGTGLNTCSPAMLLYQTRNEGFHMAQAHNALQEVVEFSLQIPANAFLFCTLAALALTPVRRQRPIGCESRDNIDDLENVIDGALS